MLDVWTFVALGIGLAVGIAAEHKLDILKPKHVDRIERDLKELRSDVMKWIKEKT